MEGFGVTMATQPATEPDRREDAERLEATFQAIRERLAAGFTGTIKLHCHKGGVPRYTIEETIEPRRV